MISAQINPDRTKIVFLYNQTAEVISDWINGTHFMLFDQSQLRNLMNELTQLR